MEKKDFKEILSEFKQKIKQEYIIELAEKMVRKKYSDEHIIELLEISPEKLKEIKDKLNH